jgi:translation initiation factor 1A
MVKYVVDRMNMLDQEQENVRIRMPKRKKNEMFAVVNKHLGGSRMNITCEDGKSRLARIPGGKRRRLRRIHIGDLVIISPWDIQDEKADIIYKYKHYQARMLDNRDLLPEILSL